jgi:hypothetical protein
VKIHTNGKSACIWRKAMKDRSFIYYANPCTICMSDPAIQNFGDIERHGRSPCRYYPDRKGCAPPQFGCVQLAGVAMARYVLQFYSEATEDTLAMERDEFKKRAPLPPKDVEAYIDSPDGGYRHIADPDLVVERVWQYARAVLDLKPGERIFRGTEESWEPPLSVQVERLVGEEVKEPEEAPEAEEAKGSFATGQ